MRPAIRADDTPQAVKQGLVWAVEAALALGENERADELLTTVESLPPGLRLPFLEAQAQRFRARMSGDAEGFKAAAARFREYDLPFWLAVTQLEHGELDGRRAVAGRGARDLRAARRDAVARAADRVRARSGGAGMTCPSCGSRERPRPQVLRRVRDRRSHGVPVVRDAERRRP